MRTSRQALARWRGHRSQPARRLSRVQLAGNGNACQSGNGRDYAGEFTDWADRISSVIPVACWIEPWADPHQTGTHQEYRDSTPYAGDAMNDRASSYALL
ncbi:hypothetical protein [Streptomyces sp. NPDC021096]|uniref:hypothetical protein n=1 Tax=Streptomyces sp. NPDC021096 TaxID=3154792 RepID=UPI0034057280